MFGLVPFFRRDRELRPLISDVENFIDRFFHEDWFLLPVFGRAFRADVRETDTEYIVEAELPGMEKENINISYDNGTLTISVKQDTFIDESRENFIRRERRSGRLQRSFYLEGVDEDKITANYKNGLLTVRLPKKEGQVRRGKTINIE